MIVAKYVQRSWQPAEESQLSYKCTSEATKTAQQQANLQKTLVRMYEVDTARYLLAEESTPSWSTMIAQICA